MTRSTGSSPTSTPFEEPRSTISTTSVTTTRAWRLDTIGSVSRTVLSELRPM